MGSYRKDFLEPVLPQITQLWYQLFFLYCMKNIFK